MNKPTKVNLAQAVNDAAIQGISNAPNNAMARLFQARNIQRQARWGGRVIKTESRPVKVSWGGRQL